MGANTVVDMTLRMRLRTALDAVVAVAREWRTPDPAVEAARRGREAQHLADLLIARDRRRP